MAVAGIIAEYNPFHNGHAYLLRRAREDTGGVIAVISGNFVQRGEPALIDKYRRTRMALSAGVDVVLELPVSAATASAERFAAGGIEILDRTHVVSDLYCGCESGDDILSAIAELLAEEPEEYRRMLQEELGGGSTFPAARSRALEARIPGSAAVLDRPNNILAVEYRKALLRRRSHMRAHGILRIGAEHGSSDITDDTYASATAIRRLLAAGSPDDPILARVLPESTRKELMYFMEADDFSLQLHDAILAMNPGADPALTYQDCSDELCRRIYACRRKLLTYTRLAEELKPRHLTRTHINRALLHILLGLRGNPHETPLRAVRLLGFRRGTPLMRRLQDDSDIPVVTKLSDAPEEWFAEDLRASEVYRAAVWAKTGITLPDDYHTGPVIL